MADKTDFDVGDVLIPNKEIMLYSFNKSKKLNIYPQVTGFDIFESLDNYTMCADFYLADGIELMNNFPVGGEEIIEVTMQTPGRDQLTFEFFVESIQGLQVNTQQNLKSYKLRCVTKDLLKNTFKVFTRRYTDMKYDEAIAELIQTDLASDVLLKTVEGTKGKFDYIVNNVRPFQVIDLIKERAVSSEGNLSSTFVFYQDRDGYHFQTIEKLIEDRKAGTDQKQFFYDTSNRASPYEKVINTRNMLGYEVINQGSSIDKVKEGAMRCQFREFDVLRGTYWYAKEYNNPTDHASFKITDDANDFNSAEYNSFTTELPAMTKMLVKDGLRPEMEHNKNVHYQRPFIQRMKQTGVRVKVYGDTSIVVGDVIMISIPDITGTTEVPKDAELFGGNYLVVNIKHQLEKRSNGEFEHFIIMEIAKPNQFGGTLG